MREASAQIIPFYAHPHVHTVINDNTFYDEATASPANNLELPFSTCVVTGADQGIDNVFVRLSDLETKTKLFGIGNFNKYGQSSLQADQLFNGSTNVWFCRVLPKNATYANMIVVANYRKGNILNALGQETGLKRLEVKFSVEHAAKPKITEGAKNDIDIIGVAESFVKSTADPQSGYLSTPLFYVRSVGRGRYGNRYSMSVRRDIDAENEFKMKMYQWGLVENGPITKLTNVFSGSIYQAARNNVSTLIDDVIDQFPTGSVPVYVHAFEESLQKMFDFYQTIVEENRRYLAGKSATAEELADLELASAITVEEFDPIFGFQMYTRNSELIPYYRNYTTKSTGAYIKPDQEVATASAMPKNLSAWGAAKVGASVLVLADENNGGRRWRYKVASIDTDTGNIVYDEGKEAFADDEQYNGIDITSDTAQRFIGGSDGDFQEITVKGETRPPTAAELKLLLSREYVAAFRGQKDRKILSPARVKLDFIFDANYNMTSGGGLDMDTSIQGMYSNSSVLTDADYQQLSTLAKTGNALSVADINVKAAMYDLNQFRNKNGMVISNQAGAGTSLYLDCGLVGIKDANDSTEINDMIKALLRFVGRATSVDLGMYSIFDPYTGKRIQVTAGYLLATKLIPHLIRYGINKPFAGELAQLTAAQRDSSLVLPNTMIRDSFKPDIDLIDWDTKELLYKNRINYYLIKDEGRTVTRAVQNTRQTDASELLEENNVRVLNILKKELEAACDSYTWNWNEPEARKGYTDAQTEKFRPWIGTLVESLEIYFEANQFEKKRMMMHCYAAVVFKGINKRIILEININRNE